MVVIRCTQKLLKRVGHHIPDLWHQRRALATGLPTCSMSGSPIRLLVAERSRLPILLPARDLKRIGEPLIDALAYVLLSLTVPALAVRHELAEMRDTVLAETNSCSVLGTMNDFTNAT